MTKKKKPEDLDKRGPKKKFSVTPETLKKIEEFAKNGAKFKQIYTYFGIKHSSWDQDKKKYPEIMEAFEKGRLEADLFVGSKLMKLIKRGSITAILQYCKARKLFEDEIEIEKTNSSSSIDADLSKLDPVEASKMYQKIMGE